MVVNEAELVEIRASQRTFSGAYWRTAISSFSFSLVILKIFTREFYRVGIVFVVFGFVMLGVATVRKRQSNKQFLDPKSKFETSGNVVILTVIICLATYASVIGLIIHLPDRRPA